MIRYKHSTLQLFPPPTGDGGCAQPPAPLPPSEPGGHATQREPNFVSLRFCLAAALRRQRLSLHEEYEEFKQRVDGQAQLLIQLLSAELAGLETDAAACAPATDAVTLPATAPEELPKDHANDDLPALKASSDSDEDITEVMDKGPPASTARDLGSPPSLPNPQSLFASPSAALYDRVATGSHCEPLNGAAPRGTPSPRSYSAALLGETLNTSSLTAVVESIRQPDHRTRSPNTNRIAHGRR